MAEDAKLKSAKVMVRSVLQSVKDGVPARRLSRDYQEITGEPIPFRQLGFPNLDAFMASIPDTAYEEWSNGERCYKAVADDSTAHIEKMVSRQKSNKKRTKGGSAHMRRPMVYARRGVRPASGYRNQGYRQQAYTPPRQQTSYNKLQRNIQESPRGSMRVTFQPTPPSGKPTMASRLGPSPVAASHEHETVLFGANYKVPPRFKRIITQNVSPTKDSFGDNLTYESVLKAYLSKQGQSPPNFETMPTADGFVSIVNLKGQTHGSGGIFATREEALEACARAACRSLGCLKAEDDHQHGDQNNAQKASQNGVPNSYTKIEIAKFRDRVKVLVNKRPNGLWLSRLPIEYKQKYNEDAPPAIDRLVMGWDDIVEVQGQENLKILYPVTSLPETPRKPAQVNPISWASPDQLVPDAEQGSIQKCNLPRIGTTCVIYPTHVEDVGHFFVHLEGSSITAITQEVASRCQSGPALKESEVRENLYVAAQSTLDDVFYRGHVRTKEGDCIYYIDFGNVERLPVNRLRELPKTLYRWPIQAVQCSVQEDYLRGSVEAAQTLSGYVDAAIKMTVNDHKDGVCIVTLYDDNDQRIFTDKPVKATDPETLELPSEDQWDVIVSYIVSANQVILRLVDQKYSEKLTALEELISKTEIPASSRYVPAAGDLCAALITTSTADDDIPWYRVRVQEVVREKVICEYLDYGDTDIVPVSQLRLLLPAEAELPYQAVIAYLTGLDGFENNTDVIEQLTAMVLDKPCIALVNSRDGDPSITLYDTSTDEDINVNEVITEVLNVRDLVPALPKEAEMSEAFVSYIGTDGVVHLQVQGPGLVKLEHEAKEVTDIYAKGGAEYFVKNLKEGRLVMALFRDGGWYRAIIRQVLPNRQVLVYFVDYGNEEVIPCTSLRELEVASKTFSSLPYQAIAVNLESLPPAGFSWTLEAVAELSERAPDDKTVCIQTVEPASGHALPIVHLSHCIDKEFYSINQEMQDPSYWMDPCVTQHATTEQVSEQLPVEKQEISEEANVSLNATSGSEGESFSDASATSQQTTELLRQLADLGIPVTDMGAAGDDMFYGVSDKMAVMTMNPAGEGEFSIKSTEPAVSVKTEPAEIATAPDSVKPESTNSQTAASPSKASSSSEVEVKTSASPNGKDLNSNDTLKVSRLSAAEYGRLAPPPKMEAPSSGSEMFITWASDPSVFTCVVYSQLEVIEDMMNSMAVFYYKEGDALTVDKPEVGTLYAGLYADERWYRVRIKNIVNQPLLGNTTMVSALLVDFGSFNLLPVTSLRQLTPEFRRLPCQAIKASLAGVSPEAGIWSEEAVSQFEDLTLEKKLVAWIHSQDTSQSIAMTLVDVDVEGEEALIHKKLIAAGLAVSSPIPPH